MGIDNAAAVDNRMNSLRFIDFVMMLYFLLKVINPDDLTPRAPYQMSFFLLIKPTSQHNPGRPRSWHTGNRISIA